MRTSLPPIRAILIVLLMSLSMTSCFLRSGWSEKKNDDKPAGPATAAPSSSAPQSRTLPPKIPPSPGSGGGGSTPAKPPKTDLPEIDEALKQEDPKV